MERKRGCRAVWRRAVGPQTRKRPILRLAHNCGECGAACRSKRPEAESGELE